jgi:hypothetical protein
MPTHNQKKIMILQNKREKHQRQSFHCLIKIKQQIEEKISSTIEIRLNMNFIKTSNLKVMIR